MIIEINIYIYDYVSVQIENNINFVRNKSLNSVILMGLIVTVLK